MGVAMNRLKELSKERGFYLPFIAVLSFGSFLIFEPY
jgi:hypothetical protein